MEFSSVNTPWFNWTPNKVGKRVYFGASRLSQRAWVGFRFVKTTPPTAARARWMTTISRNSAAPGN
ncbi:hypothetical protein [Rhodopila globiformis]|uniref:hypothetical protein n=1 Tax=Rhodopila globiformis TaxID=1071 RepID=UPI0011B0E231|nr:hypothetical protein [Rhodopila globiformis]